MNRIVPILVILLVAAAGVFWYSHDYRRPPTNFETRTVRIAAASDLRFALDEVAAELHREQPHIDVQITYGSSGNFFAQLSNHAPFDLFLSADMDYPRRLSEAGLTLPDSLFSYAVGHVVIWVSRDSNLAVEQLGVKALLDPSVRKVAVANPKYAPYGRAAVAALQSLGVYDQVKDRLVYGETVAQAAQFVQSGSAEVGVIGLSQALSPALKEHGRYWEIPADTYPRMEQGGVILSWAQDRAAAQAVRDYLTGPKGRAILLGYGFQVPGQ
jgi:molybdate transport system substrate-binding protein